jgi:CheY-like chemotaxis protein
MRRVVVVGNDGDVRGTIARMLAEREIAVVAADDAADAIARLTAMREAPDLILLDRGLARGAEGQLIDRIRSRARLHEVPIVLYTAHGSDSPQGPVEALRDAFDAELVLAIVEAICARGPQER